MMFNKLALLAFVAPLVSALQLSTPTSVTNNGQVTITWTATTTDPSTFSIELVNPAFHNSYAVVNVAQTAAGQATFTLPTVPIGGGYSFEAIEIGNINNVYSTSGEFSIAQATYTPSSTVSVSTQTLPSSYSPTISGSTSGASSSGSSSSASTSASLSSFGTGAAPGAFNFHAAPAAAFLLSAVAGAAFVF